MRTNRQLPRGDACTKPAAASKSIEWRWLLAGLVPVIGLIAAYAASAASPSPDAVTFGSNTTPTGGVYTLDHAIGFNVLDAATLDPKTGRVTLIGHRDPSYGREQIPYLEHLAVFLEHPTPRFKLEAAQGSVAPLKEFFRGPVGNRIIEAYGQLYASGAPNADVTKLLELPVGAGEAAVAQAVLQATGTSQRQPSTVDAMRDALIRSWNSSNGLAVPSTGIESTFGLGYNVRPDYIAIDPNSLVARVMFEADYLGKGLLYAPKIESSVPGYVTDFAYALQDQSGTESTGRVDAERVWFSVGNLNLAQSPDRNTLETRSTSMRVNIRTFEQDESLLAESSANEKPSGYEARLTAIYPELERKYPVLHELAECAKVAAVARWLSARKTHLRMPKAGRTRWSGPESVPGRLNAVLYIPRGHGPTAKTLTLRVELSAEGGVSLDTSRFPIPTDASVVDLSTTRVAAPPNIPNAPGAPVAWVKSAGTVGGMGYQAASVAMEDLRDAPNDTSVGTLQPFPQGVPQQQFPSGSRPPPGSVTNPQTQLNSVANSSTGAAGAAMYYDSKGDAMLGFDTAGVNSGAPSVTVAAPFGAPATAVPDAIRKNPIYQALVNSMQQRHDQENQVNQQIDQVQHSIDTAPPEEKGDLQIQKMNLKQKESYLKSQDAMDTFKISTFNVNTNVTSAATTQSSPGAAPPPPPPPAAAAPGP
jgi:hypothetical protein